VVDIRRFAHELHTTNPKSKILAFYEI
jgi:hypothetical protein